ncbi:MAG TPA: hypothetical protein PKA05_02540, partial [Roseiflexaceae bacterium]|nr:hypothetical protein [Roseiflexaceae bacterium]
NDVLPGSQAEAEMNSFKEPGRVQDAYIQANLLLEGAADHLIAFTKTVTEPATTIAPWTCVRAILESCALSAWLIDPAIDVTVRVQRSFALRYEGLDQQVKCLRAFRNIEDVDRMNNRIDEVERDALELGFPQIVNRTGTRIGIAQQMPTITDVIEITLNEEATYRIMSAMAHGHIWAYRHLGFKLVDDEGELTLEKHLEPFLVQYLCLQAVQALSKPVLLKGNLLGWDIRNIDSIFVSALADLRVP